MSDLTFNKIAGAVLATGLAVFLLREVSSIVFEKEPPEKPGYAIAVAEGAGGEGGAAAEAPIDWGTVLPTANIEAGKAVSAKCASCHNFDPAGTNGTGPGLFGVVGRKPGSHPGFNYSPAMQDFGSKTPQWDYEHLNAFLSGPQKYISGTKMTFVGLKKPEDRIAIIAYLHSLGSSLPIPPPNPAAAAAPAAGATPAAGQTGAAASGGTAGSASGQPLTGGPAGQPTSGAAAAPTATESQPAGQPGAIH